MPRDGQQTLTPTTAPAPPVDGSRAIERLGEGPHDLAAGTTQREDFDGLEKVYAPLSVEDLRPALEKRSELLPFGRNTRGRK